VKYNYVLCVLFIKKMPGGSSTNLSGLPFENAVDLRPHIDTRFRYVGKGTFRATMKSMGLRDTSVEALHGCKQPDGAYLDVDSRILVIVEVKNQMTGGSVVEKLQTAGVKRFNYKELYPTLRVEYIYILSDWFRTHCPAELRYLSTVGIPVYWGSNFKEAADYISRLR